MDSDTILQQGKLTGNVVLHILIILSILYDINKTSWRIVNIAENNVLIQYREVVTILLLRYRVMHNNNTDNNNNNNNNNNNIYLYQKKTKIKVIHKV